MAARDHGWLCSWDFFSTSSNGVCSEDEDDDDGDDDDDDASDVDDDGDASFIDEMYTWHSYPLSLVTKRWSNFGYESSHF